MRVSYFYDVAFNLDSIRNSKYFHINFRIINIEIGIDFFFTAIHIYINTAYVVFCCFHLEIVTREWFLLSFSFSPCFLLSRRYTMRPLILKGYDVKSYRSESKVLYHFFFSFFRWHRYIAVVIYYYGLLATIENKRW